MAFDIKGASEAGYSSDEILSHLKETDKSFDFNGAIKAGYNADEVLDYYGSQAITTGVPSVEDLEVVSTSDEVPVTTEPVVSDDLLQNINVTESTDTVKPDDVKATQETSLGLGLEGSTVENPQFATEAEFDKLREEAPRRDIGAEISVYTDPKTGEQIQESTVQGLQTDLPIMFGKLATLRLISKETEAALGIAAPFLSKEAQLIISRNPKLLEQDLKPMLQGIAKDDQALALANSLGHETVGNIKQAVYATDKDRILLANEMKERQKVLLDAVGPVDVMGASAKYADMVEMVSKDYKNLYDASGLTKDLDFLEKFYGTTPSKGNSVVTQMRSILGDNPKISLHDALEFRQDLNYLINKAKRGKEKIKLNSIKNNLDGFIDNVTTPGQKAQIDEAINTYSRTMDNRDLMKLVDKSTLDSRIVDWTKLKKSIHDSTLKSPEVDQAVRITEEFSKRFGNDKRLGASSAAIGSSEEASGALGTLSYMVGRFKDKFAMWGNRHDNVKIQEAILKSLRSSKSNQEFLEKLSSSKIVPREGVKEFEDMIKQIEHKPELTPTGSRNLEPLATTPKGTVGREASQVTLHDAQTQIVQEALGREASDKVMPQVKKLMDNKRFNEVFTNVGKRMKDGETEANIKMLQKIVDGEVESLVKAINRGTGVQLPASEVNKILKLKMEQLMKECE